ncbi:unnamed protein product, partial [Trichogramma brassicae]
MTLRISYLLRHHRNRKEKIDTRCIRQPTSEQETKGGKLRRLNPLSITYTRPIRSRAQQPNIESNARTTEKKIGMKRSKSVVLNEVSNSKGKIRTRNPRDFRVF